MGKSVIYFILEQNIHNGKWDLIAWWLLELIKKVNVQIQIIIKILKKSGNEKMVARVCDNRWYLLVKMKQVLRMFLACVSFCFCLHVYNIVKPEQKKSGRKANVGACVCVVRWGCWFLGIGFFVLSLIHTFSTILHSYTPRRRARLEKKWHQYYQCVALKSAKVNLVTKNCR